MGKPAIFYGPVRANGEGVRLALAASGTDFENVSIDFSVLKSDLDTYPFGQCPRYVDDDVDLVQSHAIERYLGRKHGLYGKDNIQAAHIDELLDGIRDLKSAIMPLVYRDSMKTEEAKREYWDGHLAEAAARGKCNGAHMLFVDLFIKKHGKGYAVGDQLSIADTNLVDVVDLHQRVYGKKFDKAFPDVVALKNKVEALPTIAAYLASPLRPSK